MRKVGLSQNSQKPHLDRVGVHSGEHPDFEVTERDSGESVRADPVFLRVNVVEKFPAKNGKVVPEKSVENPDLAE